MHLDPEALYEAHADRLYSYCWSLVGENAPAAVRETFAAAARHAAPRDDVVLWLYALARAVCIRQGALDRAFGGTRHPDPLRRAAARLRADHREVLVLTGGQWLDSPDVGRLLGVAADTVDELIRVARTRLERAVVDAMMRMPVDPAYGDVITAFEKGRLDVLLAGRAPQRPPATLREHVVAAFAAEAAEPMPTAESPLIVIDPAVELGRSPTAHRRARGAAELFGLTACVAAAVGLAAIWPGVQGAGTGDDGLGTLGPTASGTRYGSPRGDGSTGSSAVVSSTPGPTTAARGSEGTRAGSPPGSSGAPIGSVPSSSSGPRDGSPERSLRPIRPTTGPGGPVTRPTKGTPTTGAPDPGDPSNPPASTPTPVPSDTPLPSPSPGPEVPSTSSSPAGASIKAGAAGAASVAGTAGTGAADGAGGGAEIRRS